jgi:hypothetical protein
VPEYRMQRQLVSTRRGTVALGAATLPYEELFDRAWVKYLFENLFQNSIDFAQREYWFAVFEWMPRIKKLVLRDPVGVPSSCCTIGSGHIVLWDKDAPICRPVQRTGVITSNPILGGLRHHYIRS